MRATTDDSLKAALSATTNEEVTQNTDYSITVSLSQEQASNRQPDDKRWTLPYWGVGTNDSDPPDDGK